MWSEFLLALIAVFLGLWYYIDKQYSYFRCRNILYTRPKFLLGDVGKFKSWNDMFRLSYDVYMKFKDRDVLAGLFWITKPQIVITDLDLVHNIVVHDFKKFPNHGFYYNENKDPLSPHLYALCDERWRNMRTKLSPAFSVHSIRALFDTVNDVNMDLIQFVDGVVARGEAINARDVSMRYICDSIGSCAFGMDCGALTDNVPFLMQIADRLFTPSRKEFISCLIANAYPSIGEYLPWVGTPKDVEEYFMAIINETVQHREQNDIQRNDFMNLLIQMKNNGCLQDDESGEFIGNITTDELLAQAFLLFFLGFHTSRVMLTFALFELAGNQEVQTRAREEINAVCQGAEVNYQKLEEMTYLRQIVDETLRKYPTTGYLERVASEDYAVPNTSHVIEKGVCVMIPIMGIQNDPKLYPDPDRFDPDRMTKEKMRERHPMSFLPFGGGPRMCIGQRFGYLQVKLALMKLISQFRFTVNARTRQPRLCISNYATEFTIDEDIWLDVNRI